MAFRVPLQAVDMDDVRSYHRYSPFFDWKTKVYCRFEMGRPSRQRNEGLALKTCCWTVVLVFFFGAKKMTVALEMDSEMYSMSSVNDIYLLTLITIPLYNAWVDKF